MSKLGTTCRFCQSLLNRAIPYSLVAYAVLAINNYIYWTLNKYPNEYREGAGLHLTALLAQGVNPFGNQAPDSFYYMYGFVPAMLAVPFYALTGSEGFLILRIVSLMAIMLTAAVVALSVYKFTNRSFPPLLAGLLMLHTGWATHEIVARPDHVGTLCYVAGAILLAYKRSITSAVVSALLITLTFYSKQYFIVCAGPLFVGALFINWRRGVIFAISLGVALLVTVGLVQFAFPRYFCMVLLSYGATPTVLEHLFLQSREFLVSYWPLILLGGIGLTVTWKSEGQRDEAKHAGTNTARTGSNTSRCVPDKPLCLYWGIQMVFAVLVLMYLGQNPGAVITYFNQFLLLPLIMLSATASQSIIHKWYRAYLLYAVILISLFHTGLRLHFTKKLTEEELHAWERASRHVANARTDIDLRSPLFVQEALKGNLSFFNNGLQAHKWFLETYASLISSQSPLLYLFPAAEKMAQSSEAIIRKTAALPDSETATLVVTDTFLADQEATLLAKGYNMVEELPVRSGSQSWLVRFWRRQVKPSVIGQ